MPITVNWDNDAKTVIRYDFEGHWNWDEFRAAANEAFVFTRSVQHRVDRLAFRCAVPIQSRYENCAAKPRHNRDCWWFDVHQ
jgi:hypothetical protein